MPRYSVDFSGERRSAAIRTWMTPTEREALELAAAEAGAGLSDYVRQLCVRRLADARAVEGVRRNAAAKALADELRTIGMALDQLARHSETIANPALRNDVATIMGGLKGALARVVSL